MSAIQRALEAATRMQRTAAEIYEIASRPYRHGDPLDIWPPVASDVARYETDLAAYKWLSGASDVSMGMTIEAPYPGWVSA